MSSSKTKFQCLLVILVFSVTHGFTNQKLFLQLTHPTTMSISSPSVQRVQMPQSRLNPSTPVPTLQTRLQMLPGTKPSSSLSSLVPPLLFLLFVFSPIGSLLLGIFNGIFLLVISVPVVLFLSFQAYTKFFTMQGERDPRRGSVPTTTAPHKSSNSNTLH